MFRVPKKLAAGLMVAALLFSILLRMSSSSSSGPLSARVVNVRPGWTNVSSSPSPPPMAGAMMAYDSKADRFVLFGGWDGKMGLNSTWLYDPGNRTWKLLHPNVSPPGRGDEIFVYDERADTFILFGGWHEEANETYVRLADTWSFSLRSNTWTELHPAVSPSPRSDAQVAYNPIVDAVLLVGGFSGTAYLGDVWSYTPSNNTWSPRPAAVEPSRRADGRMVYVSTVDRFVFFGGNDYSGANRSFHHLADTWTYDWSSNVWTLLVRAVGPSSRDYPIFAFDPMTKLVLLTAGFGNGTILNDLWALNITSETWNDLTPTVSPPPRFAAAGGFDIATHVLVLFSGLANTGLLADTWHYAYGPSSGAPGLLSPIVAVGVASVGVAGIAVAIVFGLSRRRRSRGLPWTAYCPVYVSLAIVRCQARPAGRAPYLRLMNATL